MFTRILVPLDGSAESAVAVPMAATMARATGGAMTLLRVLPPGADSRLGETRQQLQGIAEQVSKDGVNVAAIVKVGDPADEILAESAARGVDLVVMRTHGRAGLERMLLGSTTEQVLAESEVPVMLLRPGGRQPAQIRILLVPVDGSPGGAMALATAVGLASTTGAAIRLLEAVVPAAMYEWVGYGGLGYYDPAWDEEAFASASSYVASLVARLHESGLQARGETRQSREVVGTIVDAAEDAAADLIVMGTQALTGVARAVMGSVADGVVRTAKCPVLLLHRVESQSAVAPSQATTTEPLAV